MELFCEPFAVVIVEWVTSFPPFYKIEFGISTISLFFELIGISEVFSYILYYFHRKYIKFNSYYHLKNALRYH